MRRRETHINFDRKRDLLILRKKVVPAEGKSRHLANSNYFFKCLCATASGSRNEAPSVDFSPPLPFLLLWPHQDNLSDNSLLLLLLPKEPSDSSTGWGGSSSGTKKKEEKEKENKRKWFSPPLLAIFLGFFSVNIFVPLPRDNLSKRREGKINRPRRRGKTVGGGMLGTPFRKKRWKRGRAPYGEISSLLLSFFCSAQRRGGEEMKLLISALAKKKVIQRQKESKKRGEGTSSSNLEKKGAKTIFFQSRVAYLARIKTPTVL